MTTVWNDSQKGSSTTDRAVCLEVLLSNQTFVFPWNQFICAAGNEEEVRVSFSTHDIVIRGSQLHLLLADLSAQRLTRVQASGRADVFRSSTTPQISSIAVQKVA